MHLAASRREDFASCRRSPDVIVAMGITLLRLLCLVCIGSPSARGDVSSDQIDRLFAQLDKPDSAGCALAVVQDGKVVYENGYGIANLDDGVRRASRPARASGASSSSSSPTRDRSRSGPSSTCPMRPSIDSSAWRLPRT